MRNTRFWLRFRGFVQLVLLSSLSSWPEVAHAQTDVSSPPAPAASASAQTEAPASLDFDHWIENQRDSLGRTCGKLAVEVVADRYAIACGAAGLWIARRDPTQGFVLMRVDDLGGPVVGLFIRSGNVWAELMRTEARPVTLGGEGPSSRAFPVERNPEAVSSRGVAPPPVVASPAVTAPRTREGRVVERLPGQVVIDLGRRDGIRFGERIELSLASTEQVGDERALQREVLAIGEVKVVSPGFSRVQLGIGERVPVGALARVVPDEASASRVAPPRLGGLWELGFMARPFLALNDLGGGLLLDASVGYRFESPFHLEAALQPLAHGTGKDHPGVTPVSTYLKASYDLPQFEVGLGVGAETVYDVEYGTEPGTGTLFVQQARIGAAEGLKLDMISHVVLFHSRFQFSGFAGTGQIPVGERSWLLLRGGGGGAGYGYGELGVRVLMKGNGDRGSFYFTGSLGGVTVFETMNLTCSEPAFEYPCSETVTYGGPLLGAGAEWRL